MTQQQFAELKDITSTLLGCTLEDQELIRSLLLGDAKDSFLATIRNIKCSALESYCTNYPAFEKQLGETLSTIQCCTLRLGARRSFFIKNAGEGAGEPLTEILYQYEYRLTLLCSWLLRRFHTTLSYDPILPLLFLECNRTPINLLMQRLSTTMRIQKVPGSLTEILLLPLRQFLHLNRPPSFAEFEKIVCYRKAVLGLLNATSVNKAAVCKLLHEQGCNSLQFLNWQVKYLKTYAKLYPTDRQKIAFFHYQLKICRQHTLCSPGLMHSGPSGTQLLDNWLSCEITYLEQKEAAPEPQKATDADTGNKLAKAKLGLTVGEISCFARFMVDAGIVQTDNFAEVIRRVCSLVQTGRAEKISTYSFLKKAQNIEPATLEVVKDYLSKMLTLARKYRAAG